MLRLKSLPSLCVKKFIQSRFSSLPLRNASEGPHVHPHLLPSSAVAAYIYPGSRVLEMSNFMTGNELNLEILSSLSSQLKYYDHNTAVDVVLFTARLDPDLEDGNTFSVGLDLLSSVQSRDDVIEKAQLLSYEISTLPIQSLVSFEGFTSGSAFGIFGGSKYRLATSNTILQLTELREGLLPIGGCAFHLVNAHRSLASSKSISHNEENKVEAAKTAEEGLAFARYLAVSQRKIESVELFALKWVSHIVSQECYTTLCLALANTLAAKYALHCTDVLSTYTLTYCSFEFSIP